MSCDGCSFEWKCFLRSINPFWRGGHWLIEMAIARYPLQPFVSYQVKLFNSLYVHPLIREMLFKIETHLLVATIYFQRCGASASTWRRGRGSRCSEVGARETIEAKQVEGCLSISLSSKSESTDWRLVASLVHTAMLPIPLRMSFFSFWICL